jgi:hypothetical protein
MPPPPHLGSISAKRSLPTRNVEHEAGDHRLTPMDRLFLAVIVSALMVLVFSSALLVDRSQSPVTLTAFAPGNEKPGKPAGRSHVKLGSLNADIHNVRDPIPSVLFLTE